MSGLTVSGTTVCGTTQQGGSIAKGNVFSVGVDGSGFQSLISFTGTGGAYPGQYPVGSLTLGGTTLYGVTEQNQGFGYGTVFSVGVNGSGFRNLISFTGAGGAYPGFNLQGGLALVGSTLYGMTAGGGNYGFGTVYSVGTNGSGFRTLLSFSGSGGASTPVSIQSAALHRVPLLPPP